MVTAIYVNPPIETDADTLADTAHQYLADNIDGYEANDNHLEAWLIAATARMNADTRTVASGVLLAIFRSYGETVIGLLPIDAIPATTATTWTMQDAAGYTIPAGTQVAFQVAGDTLIPFVTTDDVAVPPGAVSTDVGAVNIIAIDPGTGGNNLPAGPVQLLDPLSFVTAVEAVSATGGGVDAETDSEYLSRLIEELQISSPEPINPIDFAILARRIAGVHRATAVDGYDPTAAPPTTGNERMVAVALVDASGNPVSAAVKAAVAADLEARRETNFIVHVFDPTYTAVTVDFTAIAMPGYDPAAVKSAAVDALTAYLSASNWGIDAGDTVGTSWTNDDTVRYLKVSNVLNDVPGVRYVTHLTVDGGAVDVVLPGQVALPTPGAITGVVTAS